MSRSMGHESPGESRGQKPRYAQPEPYAALLAKIEELDAYTHVVLQQYPKMERHLLCHDIRRSMADIQRYAVVAWKRYHKKTTLQDMDTEVEVLRIWIRKSVHLKYITPHRYQVWTQHVNDIGRMVGGWIKAASH